MKYWYWEWTLFDNTYLVVNKHHEMFWKKTVPLSVCLMLRWRPIKCLFWLHILAGGLLLHSRVISCLQLPATMCFLGVQGRGYRTCSTGQFVTIDFLAQLNQEFRKDTGIGAVRRVYKQQIQWYKQQIIGQEEFLGAVIFRNSCSSHNYCRLL